MRNQTIIVADDHAAVRRELRAIIADDPSLRDGGVVVLDPVATGEPTSALVERIAELVPEARVVVLLLDDRARRDNAKAAQRAREDGRTRVATWRLTDRELAVLRLVALGYTNREMADMLFLSVRTVESHRASVQRKLGTSNRAELVRYAIDHGVAEF